VISYKSQGSIAARLRCGGLFSYHLTMYLSVTCSSEKFFKSVNPWQSYKQKGRLIALCALFALQWSCLKWRTGQITYLWQKENVFAFVVLLHRLFLPSVSTNIKLTNIFLQLTVLHHSLLHSVIEHGNFWTWSPNFTSRTPFHRYVMSSHGQHIVGTREWRKFGPWHDWILSLPHVLVFFIYSVY